MATATARTLRPPRAAIASTPVCDDSRLRALVGEGWHSLPLAVQRRFSKPWTPGETRLYRGRVVETRLSRAGWIYAELARIVGAPLPTDDGATGPSTVSVAENAKIGGQVWTRIYPKLAGFPQVVHSAKRFRGPTGLEEYVGCGLSMDLDVHAADGSLVFSSRRYVWQWGRLRLTIPEWLAPGAMTIVHTQDTADEFSFTLTLDHPLFGRILTQRALYRDA
jgi:hypothetical protein